MDKKDNVLEFAFSVKFIIHIENKSNFCSTTTNQKQVLIVEIIFGNRKKKPIFVIFKGFNSKPTWIKFIKNMKEEDERQGGIKMTEKDYIINKVSLH